MPDADFFDNYFLGAGGIATIERSLRRSVHRSVILLNKIQKDAFKINSKKLQMIFYAIECK
jgi:hypothetical protein